MESARQVVVFKLGDVQYGFPIEQVNEIIRFMAPAKIPNAPDYMEGIISLRGKVHAAINLRKFFGMEWQKAGEDTKIIIASGSNIGFIVDEVNMIVTPKDDEVDAATDLHGYIDKDYVQYILKVNGEIIIILNMANILDAGSKVKKVV